MLSVYGHYTFFIYFNADIGFRRQNLPSKVGPRAARVKSISGQSPVFVEERELVNHHKPVCLRNARKLYRMISKSS